MMKAAIHSEQESLLLSLISLFDTSVVRKSDNLALSLMMSVRNDLSFTVQTAVRLNA